MGQDLDSKEAAKRYGVDERTIRRWVASGKVSGRLVRNEKGGGKGGMKLIVTIDDEQITQSAERIMHRAKKNKNRQDRPANRFRIGTAIRVIRWLARRGKKYSPSSASMLRRWAEEYLKALNEERD